MSTPTRTPGVGPQVEIYIPEQRLDSPLRYMAGPHRDTRGSVLLDPTRYCTSCGLCLCDPCQDDAAAAWPTCVDCPECDVDGVGDFVAFVAGHCCRSCGEVVR